MGLKRVLGIIPNEVFLSDLSDKKYPRPDKKIFDCYHFISHISGIKI